MKFLEIFFIVGLEAIPVNFETTEFSTTSTMRVLTDHPFETTIFTTGQILIANLPTCSNIKIACLQNNKH